jgi:uncharacterized SAM-binding protein YcdF (DUF218 family)
MYRVVVLLVEPSFLLYLLTVFGLAVLWWKSPGTRRRLLWVIVPFGLLSLLSTPVIGHLALASLESCHPPLEQPPRGAGAIVVLAGHVKRADAQGDRFELGEDTQYRCLRAIDLYRPEPCWVLVSGGKVDPSSELPACAVLMREFLVAHGVRREDVLVEASSRTTHENAVECARILDEKQIDRIVLVTDAAHLYRALGCFRRQGLDAVPCGCRYRAVGGNFSFEAFIPNPATIRGFQSAWHEWLGIAWYKLRGRM